MLHNVPRSQWTWEFLDEEARSEVQLLLVHKKSKRVLLHAEEGHWVLPALLTNAISLQDISSEVKRVANIDACLWPTHIAWCEKQTRTLKRAHDGFYKTEISKIVAVLECCDDELPSFEGCEWRQQVVNFDVFHLYEDAVHRIREEIEILMTEDYPPRRFVWARYGWYKNTIALLESTTRSKIQESPVILRHKIGGVVLHARTTSGSYYVKCSNLARNDAIFSVTMAKVSPTYCELPLYADLSSGLMILRDYGEAVWAFCDADNREEQAINEWELLHVLSSIQKDSIDHVDKLIGAGFLDGRLGHLTDRLHDVIYHEQLGVLESICASRVLNSDTRYRRLHALILKLRSNATELSVKVKTVEMRALTLGMPPTVLHNDLWLRNVCRDTQTGRLKVIDWELACVGHPFMDESAFIEYMVRSWPEYCEENDLSEHFEVLRRCGAMLLALQRLNEVAMLESHLKEGSILGVLSDLGRFFRYFESEVKAH